MIVSKSSASKQSSQSFACTIVECKHIAATAAARLYDGTLRIAKGRQSARRVIHISYPCSQYSVVVNVLEEERRASFVVANPDVPQGCNALCKAGRSGPNVEPTAERLVLLIDSPPLLGLVGGMDLRAIREGEATRGGERNQVHREHTPAEPSG